MVHAVDTAVDMDGGEIGGLCTNDSAWKAARPDNLLTSWLRAAFSYVIAAADISIVHDVLADPDQMGP